MPSSNLISTAHNIYRNISFLEKKLLGELRDTIKRYDNSWLIWPNKKREDVINSMKAFLLPLSHLPNYHTVTFAQLYSICTIISNPEATDFARLVRYLDSEKFWETFNFLKQRDLLDAETFTSLCLLNERGRQNAMDLITGLKATKITWSQSNVIALLDHCAHVPVNDLINFYTVLINDCGVSDFGLISNRLTSNDIITAHLGLEALVKGGCFSVELYNKLLSNFQTKELIDLIDPLIHLKCSSAFITDQLEAFLTRKKYLSTRKIRFLQALQRFHFTSQQNEELITSTENWNIDILLDIFTICEEVGGTSFGLISDLCGKYYDKNMPEKIRILTKHSLWSLNLLQKIQEINENFYMAIVWLEKTDLLSKLSKPEIIQLLTFCKVTLSTDRSCHVFKLLLDADIIIGKKEFLFLIHNENFREYWQKCMLSLVESKPNLLTQENLILLLNLSPGKFVRMQHFIQDLQETGQLSQPNFDHALLITTHKLEKLAQGSVSKERRKEFDRPRSKLTVTDTQSSLSFFVEHRAEKDYLRGGQGYVKLCFENDNPEPTLVLKKSRSRGDKVLFRETNYNKLLGRGKSRFFMKDERAYMVSEWIKGDRLDEANGFGSNSLAKYSIAHRIQCLISFFIDLNILHQNYRVHGDIKPQNSILNIKDQSLRPIDFGSARRIHALGEYPSTRGYTDAHNQGGYHFCDDIYSAQFVVSGLFPDLFERTVDSKWKFSVADKPSILQEAMYLLLTSMSHTERTSRPRTGDILLYLHGLSESLTKEGLSELVERTLQRKELDLDDILHGKRALS